MSESDYELISEEFIEDISALKDIINHTHGARLSSRAKVSAINSSILLLSARFEEYVRQMARQAARDVVKKSESINHIPRKLSATAWKKTLESVARAKIDTGGKPLTLKDIHSSSIIKINAMLDFLGGDKSQDIYADLIHNESNMRPDQINALFSLCDIKDICLRISGNQKILTAFHQQDSGKAHGALIEFVNDFMETRNDIAHALGTLQSVGPETFENYIASFSLFAEALSEYLVSHFNDQPPSAPLKLLAAPCA